MPSLSTKYQSQINNLLIVRYLVISFPDMKLILYFKKFYRYPRTFKKLLWQAACCSLVAEYNLKLKRFDSFKPYQNNLPETVLINSMQKKQVFWMAKIMRILEKKAPWNPMCFNRATTAKRLLRQQGIETTIHFGFKKGAEKESFEGHAWLTIGGYFITGKIPQLNSFKEMKPLLDENV